MCVCVCAHCADCVARILGCLQLSIRTQIHYIARQSKANHGIAYSTARYGALHYITLRSIPLHYHAYIRTYRHYIHCTMIALHCIALHCTALHCIALHCIALHCISLHCSCISLPYLAACITLPCLALHCIPLHCIT